MRKPSIQRWLRFFPILLLSSLLGRTTGAQASPEVHSLKPQPGAPAVNQSKEEDHPRLFGIFPTYQVSNSKSPKPLSLSGKFHIVKSDLSDPFTYAGVAVDAGLGQAQNDLSGYGQGAAGYGKRYGAGLADTASSTFFEAFVFPALLHQDPRYFRMGSGPFKDRLIHALIRPVVTRKDSGGNDFNWSGILGRLASCGLSNTYYPKTDRGADVVFTRAAVGTALAVTTTIFNEFGPDVERKLFRKKQKPQP
jgi:hypothetical protein